MSKSNDEEDDEEEKEGRQAYHNRLVRQWKERGHRNQSHRGRLRFRTTFRNSILDVLRHRGWKETDHETDWDFLWIERDWIRGVYDRIRLDDHQRVNHFRNFYELTRKDCMIKNLKRAKRTLLKNGQIEESNQYDFYPETFTLPGEYLLFVEAFKKSPDTMWIMKPIGKCQGKGIFLFDKLNQISEWRNDTRWKPDNPQAEKYVAQRYIPNPYLIGGKKFDLRLYVLCTSYAPLTIYMNREGFGRFTSTRFSMASSNITDNYVHLTNVAVQKKGADYDADSGGKMYVRNLKLYLISKYGVARVNQLFCEIQLVVIRSLQSVQHIMINDKQSFELYGFDILIDSNLKVWLIEINAAPSLSANTEEDFNLKFRLLDDTCNIIDMEKRLIGNEEQVGGFDLIYRTGFVKFDHNCTVTSYLGCHNNRNHQLKKQAKQIRKRREQEAALAAKEKEKSGGDKKETRAATS
mmetsp:Transcript_31273/g.60949  ORF Transcript_31273/g.60949 Transcript_31273/m.60949 type:complete len:464 (+) Transcript_31273:28-1419(+)